MHGRIARLLALAVLVPLVAAAAPAGAKAQRSLPFRLALPAAGETATRYAKVNLVKRPAGRAAAAKLRLAMTVRDRASLPGGMAISARLWRNAKKPRKATIVVTAFRPQQASGRVVARAAQDEELRGNVRTNLFDIGVYAGGAFATDWFEAAPEFPPLCFIPARDPAAELAILTNAWTYDLDLVWRPFFRAVCQGDPDPFAGFMQTGQLPAEGPGPPRVVVNPFPGNPREVSLFVESDQPFDQVRVDAGPNTIFSQCFSGGRPCTVENPGSAGNSVLFDFPGEGVTSSGELNLRASNLDSSAWDDGFLRAALDGVNSAPVALDFP